MRIIYGEDFSNTHIVIVRFLPGEDANRFLEQFIEKYPTIGCQMFPECRGVEVSSFTTTSEMYGLIKTVHRVYLYGEFSGLADPQLINMVLKEFPAYNEDDDPIVEDEVSKFRVFSPPPIGLPDYGRSNPMSPLPRVTATVRSYDERMLSYATEDAKRQVLDKYMQ